MGIRNYLVEGVSCAGKTTVATELERRGHHVVHGDRALAYQGDPVTGEPLPGHVHEHHVWDVAEVRRIIADHSTPATYFCGGSRNFERFIDLFDEVFVLELDAATLAERLAARPADEWGGDPEEAAMVLRLHASREDIPADAVPIDSTRPLAEVVDEIERSR
ncbi:AAA family ATPase [Nocardioides hwasunensis]|uniref:AAA family ATPase n=1 Tax=Nocardioides hwasunensis TaxID=397258 RepID=A0ABR8MJU1_9ACTN|nr:AAA family ATPase [Nocardioides hwasunensis]MBD3915850.1 AAA family ATPase [Nocardioides hwasunensis]